MEMHAFVTFLIGDVINSLILEKCKTLECSKIFLPETFLEMYVALVRKDLSN